MDTPSSRRDMERTVLRLLDEENARRVCPDPRVMRYQQRGDEAIPIYGTETNKSTPVYRHADVSDAMQARIEREWYYGPNFVQKFESMCKARLNQNVFAYRPVVRISRELILDPESGLEKSFDITYYDSSRYVSYSTLWSTIEDIGRGLREIGLRQRSKVAIYLDTRWEWLASAYGVWSQNMILTTVYANLGEDALAEAFTESSCGVIITNTGRLERLVAMIRRGAIPKAVLVYMDESPVGLDTTGLTVMAWEDLAHLGGMSVAPLVLPTVADDLALVMYTSGTTGGPKGVMHTFGSITSGINGMGERLNELVGPFVPDETHVAALPLAHIFEFAVSTIFITRGALIGFGHPRTLLSTYARPHGDLEEYRPSLLIGVPRIFDTMKKMVEGLLAPRGSLERKIFDHAFASRLKFFREGLDTPFWNESVFGAFRNMAGGRQKCMFGGGGPISAPTQIFMNVVFGPFIQGWGLTETIGNGAKQLVGDFDTACVGPAEMGCEVKLVDTEDYKHTDIPEPRGEICLRGPFMFKGYFKKPEETRKVLGEDGWFRTGDIGAFTERGRLRVVSRIKALAKNSLGEYVAMEALESLYAQNDLSVPNGVCVIVHPNKNYIAAITITQENKVMKFAAEHNIRGEWPAVLKSVEFQQKALESFRETAVKGGRGNHEVIRQLRVIDDVWTPENNFLTAAGKLKRHVIAERYEDIIRELFVA